MARIRANFVSGTLSDNLLTNSSGSTTFNAAGLANLPVITGPDIAAIVLDPDGVNGAPEIVWVTAHTSNATTATVTRAQEGTALRAHGAGEVWDLTATAYDYSSISIGGIAANIADVTNTRSAGAIGTAADAGHAHSEGMSGVLTWMSL